MRLDSSKGYSCAGGKVCFICMYMFIHFTVQVGMLSSCRVMFFFT
jgi:hypothetical protein